MRTGQGGVSRGGLGAVAAVLLALAAPAQAGEWQYDPATDLVFHGSVPVAQWYGARPSMSSGTKQPGVRAYRVPRCPHRLCGYPLPIYRAREQVVRTYRGRTSAHVEWCAARYRSYDVRTDTYQPYHGPRRQCWSPYS
jgi:hypothetical protein